MSGMEAQQSMVDHVTIKAPDFNGNDFDGSPFSDGPTWLRHAIAAALIVPIAADRDYALWDVTTEHGVVRAEPGDRIEWRSATNTMRVLRRSEWYEVTPRKADEQDDDRRDAPDGGRLPMGDYHPGDEA